MSKQYIDINRLAISMVAMLVCSFIFSIAGVSWFMQGYDWSLLQAIDSLISNNNLVYAYSAIFLTTNVLALSLISSNNFTKTSVLLAIPYYFVCVAISYSGIRFIAEIVALLFSFFIVRNSTRLGVLLRFIESYLLINAYSALSMYIKLGALNLSGDIGIIGGTVFYIDFIAALYILCIIYMKGSIEYEKSNKGAYLVCRGISQGIKTAWRNRKNQEYRQKVSGREDWKKSDLVVLYTVQVGQLTLISIATAFNHKFGVFLVVYLLGYLPQKFSEKVRMDYHAATLLGCTIQSVASFYVVCAVVPDLSVSIFLPILAGAGFVAALVWFQKQIQRKEPLEELPKEDIQYLIRKSGIEGRDKEMAEMWWIKNMKNREVADILDLTESTVKGQKKIIRERLEDARN